MRDENLAYDLFDGSAPSTDPSENKALREKEQNKDDCHYIYECIHTELARRGYGCEISAVYPFNITVSAPSRAFPKLVVMRHRTGRFIAGPVGGTIARGSQGPDEDFPIFGCHDRDDVLEHVERYVNFTSPRKRTQRDDQPAEAQEEHMPRSAMDLKWLAIGAAILAIIVGASLMGAA